MSAPPSAGAQGSHGAPAERAAERFQLALGLPPQLARLLAARGWRDTAELTAFLYPRLEHTHSPWQMLGMDKAVERVQAALAAGEHIRILGDYDVDGTIATVILRQALRSLGAPADRVSYRLPQRLREGYGLQLSTIEEAVRDGVGLALTVDTGIREHAPLARARELGLDVIVTDHHLPPAVLPCALAILNPHQPGCGYPDKNLCGSAVAFKLAQALLEKAGKLDTPWPPALRSYLKLVVLGTVADSVPLLGENRIFARYGLEGLAEPVNPGLRALLAHALPAPEAGAPRPVSSRDVGFRVAPRLNAAGRMGCADRVVDLFFTPPSAAEEAARILEELNQQRQNVCAAMEAGVAARLAAHPEMLDQPILMLADAAWHRGVLGIVASRVLASTGKPVLVAALEPRPDGGAQAHGSGRAPAGVALLDWLETCKDLFDRYGGHAQAVGFSLPAERWDELRRRLLAQPPADAAVPGPPGAAGAPGGDDPFEIELRQITPEFMRQLRRLEPWGAGNPEPWFRARGLRLAQPPVRLKQKHARFELEQEGARHTALFWNLWQDERYRREAAPAWEALAPGTALEAVFRLEYSRHPRFGEQLRLILQSLSLARGARA